MLPSLSHSARHAGFFTGPMIENFKSNPDLKFSIDPTALLKKFQSRSRSRLKTIHRSTRLWFLFFNLDHFFRSITYKTGACKIHFSDVGRGPFSNRTVLKKTIHGTIKLWFQIFKRPCDPCSNFFIAIMIAFEKGFRINQTLIWNFQADFDFYFSTRLWLKIFRQTLHYFFGGKLLV